MLRNRFSEGVAGLGVISGHHLDSTQTDGQWIIVGNQGNTTLHNLGRLFIAVQIDEHPRAIKIAVGVGRVGGDGFLPGIEGQRAFPRGFVGRRDIAQQVRVGCVLRG